MDSAVRTPRARVGRPRNQQIDAAIVDATLAGLDELGYGRLTLEEVARRAGTTKPAIYRRWAGRPRLVDESLKVFVAAFRRLPPDVIGPLFAECAGDPELRAAFLATLFDPPRTAVAETLDRAHARGDLRPDVDRALILDLLASLIHYRLLFGHANTTDAEIERAVEALLQGIATDYPALLEHSRRSSGDPALHPLHS